MNLVTGLMRPTRGHIKVIDVNSLSRVAGILLFAVLVLAVATMRVRRMESVAVQADSVAQWKL